MREKIFGSAEWSRFIFPPVFSFLFLSLLGILLDRQKKCSYSTNPLILWWEKNIVRNIYSLRKFLLLPLRRFRVPQHQTLILLFPSEMDKGFRYLPLQLSLILKPFWSVYISKKFGRNSARYSRAGIPFLYSSTSNLASYSMRVSPQKSACFLICTHLSSYISSVYHFYMYLKHFVRQNE